ncbi:4-alpha-glucanotransferase [Pseudomonas sp. PDM14]|uniref:4-alpha-glucanotransferase n=1 Tax=Pseudomonas sp. PDM14 TaxID=2769288 RepID=UPI00177BB02F|nr:4-alpha-glucanotransferase [Pseudomonas sp. PDM14]MBD9484085.1 4-alpha-glucanotransferase [Pseudomonas sp. PDM14]
MSDERLAQLAEAAGLSLHWVDANGRPQYVAPDAQRALLDALGFPAQSPQQVDASLAALHAQQQGSSLPPLLTAEQSQVLPLNGHFAAHSAFQVILEDGSRVDGRLDGEGNLPALAECGYQQLRIADQQVALAVAPPACRSVLELTGRARSWGITAQLYSLRRANDAGLGDTQALEALARLAAEKGADALAISPVHAMFAANHAQYSPYSPSSRLFFNVLHAAPGAILGDAAMHAAVANAGLLAELQRLEALPLIEWPAVACSRQRILHQLYEDFAGSATPELREDFARFQREGGDALTQHCRFEALHGYMVSNALPWDWRQWPEHYRDPQSAQVQHFASQHHHEVTFHAFGQWLIARGLQRAQRAARDAGMGVGIIADLAVGTDASGSQAWSRQAELLQAVTVGAPPDVLNRSGQNWGVSAFSPTGLQQHGFRAFIEMLQANLAHAGGIRIDHVMGLKRLWVIPQGASSDAGAYLNYPLTDLLRLLALESWRHRALVIGEDLGTVPEGLREELARRNILGMRVLLFEQQHGRFIPAQHWPRDALAISTTHDLPSISGWLQGKDIDWRLQAGHSSAEQAASDRPERDRERAALVDTLVESGQLHSHHSSDEERLEASIGFLGSTPAPLVLLPLEDLTAELEQPNLPGPGDIHPNWRRRQHHPVDTLLDQPGAARRLARLCATRQEASHD